MSEAETGAVPMIYVVDDDEPVRDAIGMLLDTVDLPYESYASAQDFLDAYDPGRRGCLVLDIRMPGMSGIEAARHLDRLDGAPAVIFTTAYDEYAVEAFDARAIGYVLKPVRRERLYRALEQAARLDRGKLDELGTAKDAEPRSHVCARVGRSLRLIPVDDVHFFQADQKYVRAHHAAGDNLIDDSLKSLEQEFAGRFVRIHRSALVAVAHIEALDKTADGQVRVRLRGAAGGEPLVISRRHLAEVRRRLKGR